MEIAEVKNECSPIERSKKLDFMSRSSKLSSSDCASCGKTTRIINARVFHSGKIEEGNMWIADGKIMDAEKAFYSKANCNTLIPDEIIDAKGLIVVPGYIDIQINGGYGVDFSDPNVTIEQVHDVTRNLVATGCTAICPTIITSHPSTYQKLLPIFKAEEGSVLNGATILGVHTEGPFISKDRSGAHPKEYIQSPTECEKSILACYGSLEHVKLVTIAPELEGSLETIQYLHNHGVVVSMGHTAAHINSAIDAVSAGATLITHLFNAMTPFHHRDPGVIGILGMPDEEAPFFSIIVDGIHSHPYAVRFAQKAHGSKCVLITDAVPAMGLPDGHYTLGKQKVLVANKRAVVEDHEETLAGSIVTMEECVKNYRAFTDCSMEEAIVAATMHPAKAMNIDHRKGDLLPNMDADFLFLDDDLNVLATFIGGKLAWHREDFVVSFVH